MRKRLLSLAIKASTESQENTLYGAYGDEDITEISYVISPREDKELLVRVLEAYDHRDALDFELLLKMGNLMAEDNKFKQHSEDVSYDFSRKPRS